MKKDYYATVVLGITVPQPQDCIVDANSRLVRFETKEEGIEAMKLLRKFGINSTMYTKQ